MSHNCQCPKFWSGVLPPPCPLHNPAQATITTTGTNNPAAPTSLDEPDDPEWPYSFIVNRREYEALVKRAASLDGLTVSRAQLTRWHEALVMADMPDYDKYTEDAEAYLDALDEMLRALRDEGETT